MIKNRDILITGQQDLDVEIGSNCVNIAFEFAKANRVLYVNYPITRKTAIKEKRKESIRKRLDVIKGISPDLIKVSDNIWNLNPRCILESISQVRPDFLFDILNWINNRRFAIQIQSALTRLHFNNYIHFNDSDIFRSFYLDNWLNPAPSLKAYYTRDNLVTVNYWKQHGERVQSALMKKCDLVLANSIHLMNNGLKHNPLSFYVGQGCDFSLYDISKDTKVPDDIASIPKPIIGFIGAIMEIRLDINWIRLAAKNLPEYSFVMIGPEDEFYKSSDLHSMTNVYFLGQKRPESLASYLNYFDVAINPQVLSPGTIGNYPRKIDEYLYMGKPVVVRKTNAMEMFAEHCYLASTEEEFYHKIEMAIQNNSKEKENKRKLFASKHTWENSVNEMYLAMEKAEELKLSGNSIVKMK